MKIEKLKAECNISRICAVGFKNVEIEDMIESYEHMFNHLAKKHNVRIDGTMWIYELGKTKKGGRK